MRIALSIETLQDAYDICLLVKEHSGNVIASGEAGTPDNPLSSDHIWRDKSKRFMEAFDKATKNNPDRKKYRGDWIKKLENSLADLNKGMENLDKMVGKQ